MNRDCKKIRKQILEIAFSSGHGHIPTCFSVVEILYALYRTMRHRPQDPKWEARDRFILSKGHAALAQYCVLASQGYFPADEVKAFGGFGSRFGCHADRLKVPGVEVSTGSLGHGIGVAVGMALALKLKASESRVFTLIGDGEANEGTVWEAVLVASDQRLANMTIILDNNLSQSRGLQITVPCEKFRAFGCEVSEVDGHDIPALEKALRAKQSTVRVLVANTKKGYGCRSLVANQFEWHRKSPDATTLETLLCELDEKTV